MKCRDLLYIAFREARILKRPQGLDSNAELQDGLIFLNELIDQWAARDCYAYTTTFRTFSFTPGHQPYLVGPGLAAPDFLAFQRPTSIKSANVILNISNPPVDVPIRLRDRAWWAEERVKGIQSNIPTDLYYEPDYPNGQLFFWPVANYPYGLRLEVNITLLQFQTLDDTFLAPQAYQAALTLTLAERLSDIWGTEPPPNLARRALKARDALQSNNDRAPRISSADWGTFSRPSGDFNYMTGTTPR